MTGVWQFIIGLFVGACIGILLMGLCCAAPDYEEEDHDHDEN